MDKKINRRDFLRLSALALVGAALPAACTKNGEEPTTLLPDDISKVSTDTPRPISTQTTPPTSTITLEPSPSPEPTEAPWFTDLRSPSGDDLKITRIETDKETGWLKMINDREETAVVIKDDLGWVAWGGKVFEIGKDKEPQSVSLVGVLPERIPVRSIEISKEVNPKGKDLGDMLVGHDDKDRVILIKPAEDTNWFVAPHSVGLNNEGVPVAWEYREGRYQRFSVVDGVNELTRREKAIQELIDEKLLNPVVPGTLYPLGDQLDYGLGVKPGREQEEYDKFLSAFAETANLDVRKYWTELGYQGQWKGQELKEFLSQGITYKGEKKPPFWIPKETEKGTHFMALVSNGGNTGKVGPWKPEAFEASGGMFIDSLPYAFTSPNDYKENIWARVFHKQLLKENSGKPMPFQFGDTSGGRDFSGLLYHKNRWLFAFSQVDYYHAFPENGFGTETGERRIIDNPDIPNDPTDTVVAGVYLRVWENMLKKEGNPSRSSLFVVSSSWGSARYGDVLKTAEDDTPFYVR